ncbi:MAG: CopD family protein [Myxococcales bacterium]|jgi:putative membrane protein
MSIIIFRYLHFVGIVFWVGTALAVSMIAATRASADGALARALRRVTIRVTTPAMLVAFAGGFGMLIPKFAEVYAKQGWMHAKLALLVVLAGVTGVLTGRLRRWADGQEVDANNFRRLAWAFAVLPILIVTLAVFRPFS